MSLFSIRRSIIRVAFFGALLVLALPCALNAARTAEPPEWREPVWVKKSVDLFELEWKLKPGDSVNYHEIHSTTTSKKDEKKKRVHSLSAEHKVRGIDRDGNSDMVVYWRNLNAKGSGSEFLRFIERSSKHVGSFSLSQRGLTTLAKGSVDLRSLPLLPKLPVTVGSTWKGPVSVVFAPNFPEALASGEATFRLTGTSNVDGRKWVKVAFEADLALKATEVAIQKSLGVKQDEKEAEGGGVSISDVAPGYPAAEAGIVAGDVITAYDGHDIRNWADLRFALATSRPRKGVDVTVLRGGKRNWFRITPYTAVTGKVAAKGKLKGTYVFDATDGVLVRLVVSSLRVGSKIRVGDRDVAQTVSIKSLRELVDFTGTGRGKIVKVAPPAKKEAVTETAATTTPAKGKEALKSVKKATVTKAPEKPEKKPTVQELIDRVEKKEPSRNAKKASIKKAAQKTAVKKALEKSEPVKEPVKKEVESFLKKPLKKAIQKPVKKSPVDKTIKTARVEKKAPVSKTVIKKAVAKKTAVKKPTTTKPEVKKAAVQKASVKKAKKKPALVTNKKMAPPAKRVGGTDGSYVVSVASFATDGEAVSLSKKLLSNGFNAYKTSASVKGRTWHRVRVGLFKDQKEAEKQRLRLAGTFGLKGLWVDSANGPDIKGARLAKKNQDKPKVVKPIKRPATKKRVPIIKGFVVNAASFKGKEAAEALSKRLSSGGYDTTVLAKTVKGAKWHRVRVGPYKDKDSAQVAKKKLERDYRLGSAWVEGAPMSASTKTTPAVKKTAKKSSAPKKSLPKRSTAKKPVVKSLPGGRYVVNVISSTSGLLTRDLAGKLKADGYKAYVTESRSKGQKWYRIRVGFYKDEASAKKSALEIAKKYNAAGAWVEVAPKDEIKRHGG